MVLTADGGHSWLGRHSDPTPEELSKCALALRQHGMAGWLCITEGVYYQPEHELKVMLVRSLDGKGDYETALVAFRRRRAEVLKGS